MEGILVSKLKGLKEYWNRRGYRRLEWHFVEDEKYEHINAPKWVDFLAPDQSVDDEGWFCRSSFKHPKTMDDFIRSTTSRDQKLKRRVPTLSSASPDGKLKFNHHNSENQTQTWLPPPSNNLFKMNRVRMQPSAWKYWQWQSEMDGLNNGAVFVQSGSPIISVDKSSLIPTRHGIEAPLLARYSGALVCRAGKCC